MVPDSTIQTRILESAKEEFLQKGFLDASLTGICRRAGVTTGALYKRFQGKEELFCALVDGAVADLQKILAVKSAAPQSLSDEALVKAWEMDRDYMLWWFGFLYERFDAMRLLLARADGTRYADFEHDWVEAMCRTTYAYYLEARRRGLTQRDISERELHVLLTSFWTAICEPIVHGFSYDEAIGVSDLMCDLFDWNGMLGFMR